MMDTKPADRANDSQTEARDQIASMTPGSRLCGSIPVGNMASGAPLAIPFVAVRGASDGPCLWINGHVHGTEINGTLAALRFVNGLNPAAVKGTVVVTPTANPPAMDSRRKTAPFDEQDLDQTFPGNSNGLISDRMAAALFAQASALADVLVSMHTMGPLFDSKPYGVYKVHPNGLIGEDRLLRMLSFFQPSVACRMTVSPGAGELPGNIPGAIDYQMLERGKLAFMIELGTGDRSDEPYIAQGASGFEAMAREMGLLEGAAPPPATLRRVTKRTHVTCAKGGLFLPQAQAGEVVPAGAPLGVIHDIYGQTIETVSMPEDVVVIGLRRDPVVHTGDRVAFVAQTWSETTAG